MAQAEQPVKTRHKWTADERKELMSRLSKAKRGQASSILADFSERTGVAPDSIRAYYYMLLKKAGKSPGTPRKKATAAPKAAAKPKAKAAAKPKAKAAAKPKAKAAAKPRGRRPSTTPMQRLATQHESLRAAVTSAEGSLAQAKKALADFERKLARLA